MPLYGELGTSWGNWTALATVLCRTDSGAVLPWYGKELLELGSACPTTSLPQTWTTTDPTLWHPIYTPGDCSQPLTDGILAMWFERVAGGLADVHDNPWPVYPHYSRLYKPRNHATSVCAAPIVVVGIARYPRRVSVGSPVSAPVSVDVRWSSTAVTAAEALVEDMDEDWDAARAALVSVQAADANNTGNQASYWSAFVTAHNAYRANLRTYVDLLDVAASSAMVSALTLAQSTSVEAEP